MKDGGIVAEGGDFRAVQHRSETALDALHDAVVSGVRDIDIRADSRDPARRGKQARRTDATCATDYTGSSADRGDHSRRGDLADRMAGDIDNNQISVGIV